MYEIIFSFQSDLQTGLQWIEGCHKFAKDGTWGILVVGGWDVSLRLCSFNSLGHLL